jgi:hypothetical protein
MEMELVPQKPGFFEKPGFYADSLEASFQRKTYIFSKVF